MWWWRWWWWSGRGGLWDNICEATNHINLGQTWHMWPQMLLKLSATSECAARRPLCGGDGGPRVGAALIAALKVMLKKHIWLPLCGRRDATPTRHKLTEHF